jgi:hypothetical protein
VLLLITLRVALLICDRRLRLRLVGPPKATGRRNHLMDCDAIDDPADPGDGLGDGGGMLLLFLGPHKAAELHHPVERFNVHVVELVDRLASQAVLDFTCEMLVIRDSPGTARLVVMTPCAASGDPENGSESSDEYDSFER